MISKNYVNDLSFKIIGSAIEVHKELEPGLLETVYEKCLIYELKKRGLQVQSQLSIPVKYKTIQMDCDLRLDILVNDLIIVELKSVEMLIPIFQAQLMTYLRLLNKPKGLLINFNSEKVTENIISLVTPVFAKLPEN